MAVPESLTEIFLVRSRHVPVIARETVIAFGNRVTGLVYGLQPDVDDRQTRGPGKQCGECLVSWNVSVLRDLELEYVARRRFSLRKQMSSIPHENWKLVLGACQ